MASEACVGPFPHAIDGIVGVCCKNVLRSGLIVALLAGLLLFTSLDYPLLEPEEARYAEIPLLMMQSGDYVVPHLQGKPYNDKPPLTYWLVAGAYRLLGVHDWAARLVPAVAAWLCVLVVFAWSCRCLDVRSALANALLLCTIIGFMRFGRTLILDGVLSLSVVLALACGNLALARPKLGLGWWVLSAVCCGLGVLTKGPVAMALVMPPLLAYRWLDRQSARWRCHGMGIYLLATLLVAAPWYVLVHLRNQDFTWEFLWNHNVLRYVAPELHVKPWWYYVPALAIELMPWTPLLPLLIWHWKRHGLPAHQRFWGAAAAWGFVFFSMAGCKLPTYLMPTLPLLAITLGAGLGDLLRVQNGWLLRLTPVLSVTAMAMGIVAQEWRRADDYPGHGMHWFLVALVASMALASCLVWVALSARMAWAWCGVAGCMLTTCWTWHVIPARAAECSTAHAMQRILRAADGMGAPVIAYQGTWDAAGFYRGGDELPVFAASERDALLQYVRTHDRAFVVFHVTSRCDGFGLARTLPKDLVPKRTLTYGNVQGVLIRRHRP